MDAASDPDIREVVIVKSAQVGGTQLLLNIAGFHVHLEPSPILWVSTTVGEVETFSKDRFEPFRRDNPVIAEKIADPKSRDGDNVILDKRFRGGRLLFRGANAPSGLRSHPIRVLIMDEVDGYPATTAEGEPTRLAKKRTQAFWNRRIVQCSTPGELSTSRIVPAYEASDQRRYHVPCPDCGHKQTLQWSQVVWDKTEDGRHLPETAAYGCENCGALWSNVERMAAVAAGEWIAERPEVTAVAGFHINELMSPFVSLAEMVVGFLDAKDDPTKLRIWTNTTLGEPWQERGEAPDYERLYERRERYKRGIIPSRGLILTAGVDVQRDRLEIEIVAWGRGLESWSVDYRVFHGDPAHDEVWQGLDVVLGETFQHQSGSEFRIARLAIDSGFETHRVYDWRRKIGDNRIILVKGFDRLPQILGRPSWVEVNASGKMIKRGVQVWPIGVSFLKGELYSWLRLPMPAGDGSACYCHFPQYDREHFEQLAAEQLVTKTVKGYPRREWQKIRGRNEALDCRIYARAAAAHLGLDNWTERRWAELEALVTAQKTKAPPAGQPAARPRQTDWLDRGGRGGWLNRGGRGGWLR
jgi:phage terminase large subunit GpA-like protein